MHYDLLENTSRSLVLIDCDFSGNMLKVGWIFADRLQNKEQIVTTKALGTYKLTFTEEYLNIPLGCQFNVTIPAIEIKERPNTTN